ncbi:MAG TPA: choice-of-anchor Q domain-containing protein [Anaerolineales bacterium]|nr:choice-of-anchor Q domain-containing protein [Anaerolineales bacterium]
MKTNPFLPHLILSLLLLASVGAANLPSQAATIAVTTSIDIVSMDGQCSLREAVIAANRDSPFSDCPAGSGADTIDLSGLPTPVTFSLTLAGANEDASLSGDLDISSSLTIQGAGLGNSVIDGEGIDRIFQVLSGARLTLSGLTVQNGNPPGGEGGGIKVQGSLVMIDSAVQDNLGGGIANLGGSLTLNAVQINGNAGGYAIRNLNHGVLIFTGGQVSANQGGGIYNNASTATLTALTISDNTGGGGIVNTGFSLANLTLNQSQVTSNTAASGGGIFNEGVGAVVKVYDSTLSRNGATFGGGGVLNNGIMVLQGSTLDHNQARTGGGIDHLGGNLQLTNVTFSANSALDNGGGLYNRSDATLTNVTLNANAASGLGSGGNLFNDSAQVIFRNTIVANSPDGNCVNSEGFITSSGHNLESGDTCGFHAVGDQVNTDPLLGPLQNNGGYTYTQALLPGSPAIDQGDNALCPAVDQRGVSRPQGAACDVGAYEYGGEPPVQKYLLYLPLVMGR